MKKLNRNACRDSMIYLNNRCKPEDDSMLQLDRWNCWYDQRQLITRDSRKKHLIARNNVLFNQPRRPSINSFRAAIEIPLIRKDESYKGEFEVRSPAYLPSIRQPHRSRIPHHRNRESRELEDKQRSDIFATSNYRPPNPKVERNMIEFLRRISNEVWKRYFEWSRRDPCVLPEGKAARSKSQRDDASSSVY